MKLPPPGAHLLVPDCWNMNCRAVGRMNRNSRICTLNIWAGEAPCVQVPQSPTRERLDRGFYRLQNIQLVRNHRQDPSFGKSTEERIIWRELLELELHALDEQIDQMAAAAGYRA